MSNKPVFVFVPGAGLTTKYFDKILASLAEHGYSGTAVALPSVDANPSVYDFSVDVVAIREEVRKLVEEDGKDLVVAVHSYGGLPASEALRGLGKKEREANGLQGGVERLVFIMAFVAPEHVALGGERGDTSRMMPYQKLDLKAGTSVVLPEDAKRVFFNDLSEAEASMWAAQVRPQSIGVFWSTLSYAAWRHIPSTYVLCEQDQTVPVAVAEMMLENARQIQPDSFDTAERIASGHFPMLSQVESMLRILRKAAGEQV